MDSINQRLNIFFQSGIITSEEKEILIRWIEMIQEFSSEYSIEKLERMITHCAMMMKRQREKEDLGRLPEEFYLSIKEHELYDDCMELLKQMTSLYPVNDQEERYLILHLCSCFE